MDSLIGQTVGNYEIISLLGEGGMATVYRAQQTNMRREVAFKIIRSGMSGSADFVQRFEREVQTVATLNHPHILKVFDFGQVNGAAYLVMELQAGGSLTTLIEAGPLDTARAATLLDQIASALDYAHRKGVIHRDLKPQNILLDTEGNAILTDFGIAKVLNTAGMTQTGMTVGTPTYMAPEQWQGLPLDARSDEYALGIVLYQMLSGKLPFNGDTPFAVMHKHIYDAPPSIIADRPDLSPAVDMVIKRAMAKNRDDRFATAGELAAAFRAALQGQMPSVPLMQTTPPILPLARTVAEIPVTTAAAPPRERGGWMVALVGLLAVAFFVFGAVLIYTLSRGPAAFAAVTTPTVAAVAIQPSATRLPNTTAPTQIPATKAPPTVAPSAIPPTVVSTLVPSVVPTNAAVVVAILPTATPDTRETQIAIAQATLQANMAALNTISAVMTASAPTRPTVVSPTTAPTIRPTNTALSPTIAPTIIPTVQPTQASSATTIPTLAPTVAPTIAPTTVPTTAPGVGNLTFANFAKEAYLDSVTAAVTGFPLPGEGLQYDVWLSDRVHAPLLLGKLPVRADGAGRLTYNDPRGANLLLTYSVVFITLQGKETTPQGAVRFSGALPPQANVHFQHVLVKYPDTPKNVGLIIGAIQIGRAHV